MGDQYLDVHFQVDAEGSFRFGRGLTALVSAWNLNNEPFDQYQGSPKYVLLREFYGTTYVFGVRWNLGEH